MHAKLFFFLFLFFLFGFVSNINAVSITGCTDLTDAGPHTIDANITATQNGCINVTARGTVILGNNNIINATGFNNNAFTTNTTIWIYNVTFLNYSIAINTDQLINLSGATFRDSTSDHSRLINSTVSLNLIENILVANLSSNFTLISNQTTKNNT